MFNSLYYLNFQTLFVNDEEVSFNDLLLRKQMFSQTLLELHINVRISMIVSINLVVL